MSLLLPPLRNVLGTDRRICNPVVVFDKRLLSRVFVLTLERVIGCRSTFTTSKNRLKVKRFLAKFSDFFVHACFTVRYELTTN